MLAKGIIEHINLYVNHNVGVVFENPDEPELFGELIFADKDKLIVKTDEPESRELNADEVKDIRYRGVLTDFHTNENAGEIDNAYNFRLNDCISENEKTSLRYHVADYKVSCHLVLERDETFGTGSNENSDNDSDSAGVIKNRLGCIAAKDVIIESNPVHILNTDVLTAGNFLYTFRNGEKKAGMLEVAEDGLRLSYSGKHVCSFSREDIADITKFPKVNDSVVADTDNGEIAGIVTAVKENEFYIYTVDRSFTSVKFSELKLLRYQGTVSEYNPISGKRQFFLDGKFWTKEAYFSDWYENGGSKNVLKKGMVLSYTVAVNERGMIAKDLYIEHNLDYSRTGVIIMMDNYGKGWIGSHFIAKAKKEKLTGDVYFTKDDLPKNMVYNPERYIYIVKYSTESKPDANGNYKLLSMEYDPAMRLDYASTGAVHISAKGEVKVIPFFRTCIEHYMDREVCVILKDSSRKVLGRLVSVDEKADECTVLCEDDIETETKTISFKDIENIRIIGIVTKYYDNGTGYIGKNYFNIKNVKNGQAYSDLEGRRVSFLLQSAYKGDLTDAVELEVLEDIKPKAKTALVIAEKNLMVIGYDKEKGYNVMDTDDYDSYSDMESSSYYVAALGDNKTSTESLNFEKYDYPVVIKTLRRDGKSETEVKFGSGVNKRQKGYLTKVIEKDGKRFGFINRTPNWELGGVYCRIHESIFGSEAISNYDFNTRKHYYPVLFTIQYDIENKPAKSVRILGEEPILYNSEQKKNYRYGFVTSYRKADDVAVIYNEYNISEGFKATVRKEAKLKALGWNENVNTSNKVYFITYEVKGNEVSRIVNMEGYSRKGILSATAKDGVAEIKRETFREPEGADKTALDMIEGETLIIGNQIYQYAGKEDEALLLREGAADGMTGAVIRYVPGEEEIYRIGVLTGADDAFEYAYINDYLKFSTEKLVERTHKVFKNDSKKLLVIYSLDKDRTVKNVMIPEDAIKGLFPWRRGNVVSVTTEERKERKAVMKCEDSNLAADYYYYVDTDSAISNLGKDLEGLSVYAQLAKCSAGKTEEYSNKLLALELRCEYEKMYVEEYTKEGEAGSASVGYRVKRDSRDKKNIFQVNMRHYDFWKANKDNTVEVVFKPYRSEADDTEVLMAFPRMVKYKNPYTNAAAGAHLEGGDEMFKGRDEEKKEIWNYIIDSNKSVIKGRRVFLYGQKRCGKSSLVEMIKYDMSQSDEIKEKTILVSVTAANIPYSGLAEAFGISIMDAIGDTLDERGAENCDKLFEDIDEARDAFSWDSFKNVVNDFYKQFPQYSIILFVDEFTRVCMQVLKAWLKETETEKKDKLSGTLLVTNSLEELRISQVIIGHANMIYALKMLGLSNETTEKSLTKRLNAFSYDDAKSLIIEPMEEVFGKGKYYSEEDNNAAMKYMMELSGNSPYVLMNLCQRVFEYYAGNKIGSIITVGDVDMIARDFCSDIRNTDNDTFDAILFEVGDEEGVMDEQKLTYIFLENMVPLLLKEGDRYCAKEDIIGVLRSVDGDFWNADRIDGMIETLKSRGVIEEGEGERYKIVMGLFVRYIQLKKGLK